MRDEPETAELDNLQSIQSVSHRGEFRGLFRKFQIFSACARAAILAQNYSSPSKDSAAGRRLSCSDQPIAAMPERRGGGP
jgi:hypothetical protein